MEQKTKKREWVKTAAIIFLAVLLVLTFFSQTIMNHSLPEVAVQSVSSGTINAKIRANGSVTANETYDVTIQQTRTIRSVKVSVGDTVSEGDVLFTLEAMESDELKAAEAQLADMERSYQSLLTELSNTSSRENRQTQKLQEAYDEALAAYKRYTSTDPKKLDAELASAEDWLKELQDRLSDTQKVYNELLSDPDYTGLQAEFDALNTQFEAALTQAQEAIRSLFTSVGRNPDTFRISANTKPADIQLWLRRMTAVSYDAAYADINAAAAQQKLQDAKNTLLKDQTDLSVDDGKANVYTDPSGKAYTNQEMYELYLAHTDVDGYDLELLRKECAAEGKEEFFRNFLLNHAEDASAITVSYTRALIYSYNLIKADMDAVAQAQATADAITAAVSAIDTLLTDLDAYQRVSSELAAYETSKDSYTCAIESMEEAVEEQTEVVNELQQAVGAAAAVETAKEALEDYLFELGLGSSDNLDLQAQKDAIEAQKQLIEQLTKDADGAEITAPVSGTVSQINVNAGNKAGAESTLAVITVTDRGYTMRVTVTTEQARQVHIGDTADISNYYWGNITATLENILNDPQGMGQSKFLVFRLTGDVEPGANLTLSIGQRSAPYDAIIPNSAIRTDSNGSFVLMVTAKNSPLGNRYIATRVDITVLASDDTHSAVTGLVNGDFVITTSSAPIEAGNQVRMVDGE